MNEKYKPRIADEILREKLEITGAVLIEGAKWCGKTRTASENSKSMLFMQNPDKRSEYKTIASTKPSLLLSGECPRLLDEWQSAPVLWDAVRFAVDDRGKTGQFILTGSAKPNDNVVEHSGTGRISKMIMRPMSLFESGESNGNVSLKNLFDGNFVEGETNLTIEKISELIVRGGWPAALNLNIKNSSMQAIDYVESVINNDITSADDVEKNPMRVRAIMKSLARNVSTMASLKTIYNDIVTNDVGDALSEKTISNYLLALERIFVIDNLLAWNPSIRSKTAIRSSVKRHFVDPSIATAILRLTPEKILKDFNYFGFLFESLCTRDLKIYAQSIDGDVYHYKDASDLEVDTVVALNDGRWAAIEIKLGTINIEEGVSNLKKLRDKVNTEKMNEPSFLAIVTAEGYSYQREDGIYIIPIGSLKN